MMLIQQLLLPLSPQEPQTLQRSKDSSMHKKPLNQHVEPLVPDVRRPCQMVPSDQEETRPPALRDSAAVPPESQSAKPP